MSQEQYLELQSVPELYSLSLFSASTLNALPKPRDAELSRFPFFVTRSDEDQRIRFHLHMGIFDRKESAMEQLAIIRTIYPLAWVSLLSHELVEGKIRPVSIFGKSDALFRKSELLQTEPENFLPGPEVLCVAESSEGAAPGRESLKRKLHTGKVLSVKRGTGALECVEDAKYAVQLLWSVFPISLDRITAVELFDEYTLYTAECERNDRKWYALRLGFFKKAPPAMAIAKYLRNDFYSAALIPVMPREILEVKRLASANDQQEIPPEEISLLLGSS